MNEFQEASESVEADGRLNEVMAAYAEAVRAGQSPDRPAILAAHPDLAGELSAFFDDHDRLRRLARPLRAVAHGAAIEQTAPFESARPRDGEATTAHGDGSTGLAPGLRIHYFGDYELLREVARGGMGVVFEARQRSLNRVVALKMILAGPLASEGDLIRFRNEAESVAALDHPNIVPIYEVGVHDGQGYFSMKLIEGGSLAEHLPEFAADSRASASLVATVARAVHHAHQRGILHRDLKPSNILIDAARNPHVTDFGLARRIEADGELTGSGAILGSPPYMSPEQAGGKRGAITTATDVYGLGSILYTILAGKPPFRADSVQETLEQVRERAPDPPSLAGRPVDRDLETICLKCLEKESGRRYESAAALADELDRWLRGEPISARPVSRSERAWRWCRRNPAVAGLSAATCVLVIGGIVGLAISRERIRSQRDATQRQFSRAEANYLLACEVVDQMLTEVGQNTLADVPQVEPVRRVLLAKALEFYKRLLSQKRDDPAIRLEVARAYMRVGNIQRGLGQTAAANEAYAKSIALLTTLRIERPDDPALPRELADCERQWAALLMSTGRSNEGERALHRAQTLLKAPKTPGRDTRESREALKAVQNHLGVLLVHSLRLDEAEAAYLESLRTLEQLAAAFPDSTKYQSDLGATYSNLAQVEIKRRNPAAARPHLERAIAHQQAALRVDPHNREYREFARNHVENLGLVLSDLNQTEEALNALGEAVAAGKTLVNDFPYTPRYRSDLAGTHANLAIMLSHRGRNRDAERGYREALDLLEALVTSYPDNSSYRSGAAQAYEIMGMFLHDNARFADEEQALSRAVQALEYLVAKETGDAASRDSLRNCRKRLARLLVTCPDTRVQDPSRAIALAKAAIKMAPKEAVNWFVLGAAQYRVGDWDAAIKALNEASGLAKQDPHPAIFLAMAHWQRGNRIQARSCYANAVKWMQRRNSAELDRFRAEAEALFGQAGSAEPPAKGAASRDR